MVVCSFEMMSWPSNVRYWLCGIVIVTSPRVDLYVCIRVCWGVARFREHPSNMMGIALSRVGRLGASRLSLGLFACHISPAAFSPRVSHAADGLLCA